MFSIQIFLRLFLSASVLASLQINLHHTDWVNDRKSSVAFQHDCIHLAASIKEETDPHQLISYCLTEWSSEWNIQENRRDPRFTFAQLHKQNITSEQLYVWSAPIDLIENYEFFLNQLSTSNEPSSIPSQLFYNCTPPRFGLFCQYSLDIDSIVSSSLNEIIDDFYQQKYEFTELTCYTHLECDRNSSLRCLDWTDICDGTIDCRGGTDEEFCWQLESNECADNEHRCLNGQCISSIFYFDDTNTYECLDGSDVFYYGTPSYLHVIGEPTFAIEDISCSRRDTGLMVKFSSSCTLMRQEILQPLLISSKSNNVSNDCRLAVNCQLAFLNRFDQTCRDLAYNRTFTDIINETCPDMLYVPAEAVMYTHIHFLYTKENLRKSYISVPPPQYICYDDQLCDGFESNTTSILFENSTCRQPASFSFSWTSIGFSRGNWNSNYVLPVHRKLPQCNRMNYKICNSSSMYQCINSSKCISKHRLCDGFPDCVYKDDELCPMINGSCLHYGMKKPFKCSAKNSCIPAIFVNNDICNCAVNIYELCEDEPNLNVVRKYLSFPIICDGFIELAPVIIDGRNETDETECEYWQCNNTYTRCDGFWNCFNGADEIGCDPLPFLECPTNHHVCVSHTTNQFKCLPLEKANDGHYDCLGGTDEPKLCRSENYNPDYTNFYCRNDSSSLCIDSKNFCNQNRYCLHNDDEQFCDQTRNFTLESALCNDENQAVRSNVEHFFCKRPIDSVKLTMKHFSLGKSSDLIEQKIEEDADATTLRPLLRQGTILQRCHRGLPLRIWFNNKRNSTNITCLCPPSFYGDRCQYQNQRVSLTIQFQTFSDSRRTLFGIVVLLMDDSDQRVIHSYQQFTYIYIRDCHRKFNIYLLYSTRPKHLNKNYSIHIDIYNKMSFEYRRSYLIPLKFPFLPVYRVAVHLDIPRTIDHIQRCSTEYCNHGRCIHYADNSKGHRFCQCHSGWSGKDCSIPHICKCSPASVCIGVAANNQSICLCPLNRWGSLCFLRDPICQSGPNGTCSNHGQCIPGDQNTGSNEQFSCVCQRRFSGKRCEITDHKIIVSFDKDILLSQSILVHFIQVIDEGPPENGSIFKNIPANHNSVVISWSRPFHIAFLEVSLNNLHYYYLIDVRTTYNQSDTTVRTIHSFDRCQHINEVFNETILRLHHLRRMKYYHLPCRNRSLPLPCFYDEVHFCLCIDDGYQRLANCFEFNHTKKHDCFGLSNCRNKGQCLQDRPTCPQTSICICPECYHGLLCQFSSSLFGLSLDAILGYHIQTHIGIAEQPYVVLISLALTIAVMIGGLIDGTLSLMTFKNKEVHQSGAALYLLASSMTTLVTMTVFALKFWILLTAQMAYVTNRLFLHYQCVFIDYLLGISLNMDQWLKACVSMERTMGVIKGTNFGRKRSQQIAKYIILFFLVLMLSTTIHDPIYRHLIDDSDSESESDGEKRIWCVVTYSQNWKMYSSVINSLYFLAPFLINAISAITIIKKSTKQQAKLHTRQSYHQLLYKQLQQHRHILVAPILLVILAVPRLIISFVSGCMKSYDDSWLFLLGYFISFIPSTLTFVIFVIPSTLYKQEFYKFINRVRLGVQRRVGLTS